MLNLILYLLKNIKLYSVHHQSKSLAYRSYYYENLNYKCKCLACENDYPNFENQILARISFPGQNRLNCTEYIAKYYNQYPCRQLYEAVQLLYKYNHFYYGHKSINPRINALKSVSI